VPLYISEIAPADRRGRLVSAHQLLLTVGILTAYCVDLAFIHSGRWHAMFAVGLVPAAALLVGMLRAPEPAVQSRPTHTRELLRQSARPALAIAFVLAAVQQLSGINAIVSFAPSIMEKAGLAASSSLLYAVVIGLVNVAATVVSVPLVDRAGRRALLLGSLAGLFLTLTLLGVSFELGLDSRISLACLVAYVFAFAVGLGPVFWVLIAEIFPLRSRAAGASVAVAAVWFWNFAVGFSFLPLASAIGQPATFWIYAAACLGGLVFVYRRVPETKGRRLEEIEAQIAA
jgi:SP family galactose:H+ symporter-like MFS transporter